MILGVYVHTCRASGRMHHCCPLLLLPPPWGVLLLQASVARLLSMSTRRLQCPASGLWVM